VLEDIFSVSVINAVAALFCLEILDDLFDLLANVGWFHLAVGVCI
jgi:hypothetical protein